MITWKDSLRLIHYFMCACLHIYIMYVHRMRAVPTEPEEGTRDPRIRIVNDFVVGIEPGSTARAASTLDH